jgi:bifunctional DNA-binding transcriptional regulator/antitoxin component of YhaV-PrlF toxin-antitoxin module
MRRVTGNFQITLPKRLVDVYDIQVGDEVESVATGESIAIVPARSRRPELSIGERLRLFDQSIGLQAKRDRDQSRTASGERGGAREERHPRGRRP